MKSINNFLNEALIKKDTQIRHNNIISSYQNGDNMEEIVDNFYEIYNIILWRNNNGYNCPYGLSTILYDYRKFDGWEHADHGDNGRKCEEIIVAYIIAKNIDISNDKTIISNSIAQALNIITSDGWKSQKCRGKNHIIRLKNKDKYILDVYKD